MAQRSRFVVALALAAALLALPVAAEDVSSLRIGRAAALQSGVRLCVLLTDNSRKTFVYLNGMRDSLAGSAMSGFDSRRMVADVNSALQSRFREVAAIDSVAELQARGCGLAMSLDLKIRMSPGIRKEGVAEIAASFADRNGVRIEGVAVTATRLSWGSIGDAARDAWDAALGEFGSKLDQSGPLLAGSGNAPELAAPVPAPAAAARAEVAASPPAPLPGGTPNFGSYHALVIGINNYRTVTPLKTAISDAQTVAELLQKDYGFKVNLLLDATRSQMLDAFDDLRRRLTEGDNLLIYYAGHGHLDTESDRGFWLPVDADANRRANWLSNSDIADMVRGTRAKHVLVVADSCYAGTLTRSLAVEMSALDDYARLAQKRARTALVSGGLEPVADAGGGGHSVFAKAFLDALNANTGVADMSRIFSGMRRQVLLNALQTPQYSDIRQAGHEGGDFIFVRRK